VFCVNIDTARESISSSIQLELALLIDLYSWPISCPLPLLCRLASCITALGKSYVCVAWPGASAVTAALCILIFLYQTLSPEMGIAPTTCKPSTACYMNKLQADTEFLNHSELSQQQSCPNCSFVMLRHNAVLSLQL